MILEILLVLFALFMINKDFKRFKQNKISIWGFVFWFVIWVGLIAAILIPGITEFIAFNIGIGRGVDVVIYISIALLFYLSFRTDMKIEKTNQDITKIVRELTFMNERVKKK